MTRRDPLARAVGRALLARAARVAFAESCTAGLIASRIASVPGSSRYLLGAVVAYHNRAKTKIVRVPQATLRRHGAVSAPVAAAMARGARNLFGADVGVAVTGIAGPGGGSAGKPVGLVHLAVCGFGGGGLRRRVVFTGSRQQVQTRAADLALIMLLEYLEHER